MNKKNMSVLVALFLVLMSASVVMGEGSDPLDPSDGGADWDGDGLTNAEEQQHGTDMTKADTDGDGLWDDLKAIRDFLKPFDKEETPVTLDSRKGVVYGDVVAVLDIIIRAKFEQVSFAGSFEEE